MSATLSPSVRRSVELLSRRRLVAPALLWLAGHRPLAFAAGQMAALAAPLASLMGQPVVQEWADLLSTPDGPDALQRALHQALDAQE
ncbi:MAG: hypothetical protein H3C34_07955 [Caldilineaceae bacterium]|nr:hypothetical protein [Caldilineaceae bacterium]